MRCPEEIWLDKDTNLIAELTTLFKYFLYYGVSMNDLEIVLRNIAFLKPYRVLYNLHTEMIISKYFHFTKFYHLPNYQEILK